MGHLLVCVTTLLLAAAQKGRTEMTTEASAGNSSEILRDLEAYLQEKILKFKLDLHKTYESSRLRHKRDTGHMTTLPDHNALYEEQIKIESLESDHGQSISQYPLTSWTSVQSASNHYVFMGTSLGELLLLSFHGNKFSVLFNMQGDVTYKLMHFIYRDEVWFAAVHHRGEHHYIQLYVFTGDTLFKKQAIHLDGQLDIEVMHNRGTWYMAVISKKNLANHAYHAEFLLYNWRHTQFDMLAKTQSPGCHSVAMWDIEGTMYIAVAQALTQGKTVGSPIFAYHARDDDKLTYTQIIRANLPRKVLHFRVHANHYLLFLCPHGVTIYWWAGDQFLEWLVLENTGNAKDAAVLELPNAEVAIAVAYKSSIHFYMEDFTSRYVLVYKLDLVQEHILAGISFFYRADSYYYLIALVEEGYTLMMPNMWRMNITSHTTRSMKKWDPLVTCLMALNDTLNTKQEDLNFIGSQIDRVWMTNKNQTITADVFVHGPVQANRHLAVQDVHITADNPQVPQITNGQVRNGILDLHSGVEGLKADLNNIAFKSRDQTIHGPLRFTKPVAVKNGGIGNVARDVMMNDVPISTLKNLALKTNGEQAVSGDFIVPDVKVHNLEVEGHLNKINPNDLLLLHGDQIVTGTLHFPEAVVRDLIIKKGGTINGLNPASFVTTNTPQVITGIKTFKNIQAKKNIDVRGMTNNQDLSALANKAVLTTGPISDNVEFTGPVVIKGNLNIRGKINNVINVTALATDAVDSESEQFIEGQKVFKAPVHVRGDVSVEGKTNGMNLRDELFTLNTEQNVPGNLSFLDSVHFLDDLEVGLVNGLPLEQEAVLKSAPDQVILGHKTFRTGASVNGDVQTSPHSSLNGIDLSEIAKGATQPNNLTLYGQTIFHDLIIDGSAMLLGTFNGISLADFDTLVWRKSLNQVIGGPATLPGQVVFENDLEVTGTVNGLNLDDDLVHTFQDEEIEGVKSFADNVAIASPLLMAPGVQINGFDLPQISRSVVRANGQPQVVYGRKMFPNLEVLGDVHMRGLVNGLDLSEELMLSDQKQMVTGHMTMASRTTFVKGVLRAKQINLEHDTNGVDLSEFARQAVMADYSNQYPIMDKNFLGGLKVGNIWSERINDVDVDHLLHKAVRIDSPQVLQSPKNFTDLEFVGIHAGTLNGLDLHQYLDSVVSVGEAILFGPKTVAGSLKINGDLKTFGPINGVDIQDVAARALYRDADNVITAPMSFAKDLDVGQLHLGQSSAIDGISWENLIFLDREEFLQGNNHFQDDMVIEGNIAVAGLVDGCNLNELAESALYRDKKQQTMNGPMTIENLHLHGNIIVDGPINGLDVNKLASGILRKSSDQSVKGNVGFYSQVNVKHLQVANLVNGNNLDHLFRDAVLKSQPQEISGVKIVMNPEGVAFEDDLTVENDLNTEGKVNGIDISHLRDSTVYKQGNQVIFGQKIFNDIETRNGVRVAGLVNDIKIPSDLVFSYGDDAIPADTTFAGPITMRGNLVLSGTVNGINLDQLVADRVTLHGADIIFANLTFVTPIEIGTLQLPGMINGIPVESLVTKSGSHIVDGIKKFNGNVFIDGDLDTHLLNDMDLRDLDANILRHNRDEIIRGLTVFRDPVQLDGDVIVQGTVNDLNIASLPHNLQQYRDDTDHFVDDLRSQAEMQNLQLRKQFDSHTNQFSEFAYFEMVQVLPVRMTKLFSSVTYGFSRPAFVAKPASRLFGWTADGCSDLDCCSQNTFVFSVENNGEITFESGPHHKRLFAFVFSNSTFFMPGYLNGFLLWTNTSSRTINCGFVDAEETVIVSLHGTGLSPLESKQAMTNFQAEYSPYVEDAKVLEIDSKIYMLVAYSYNKKNASSGPTIVYLYDAHTNTWSHHQTLLTDGSLRLDVTQIVIERTMVTLLAIAARPVSIRSNDTRGPYTAVYKWNEHSMKFMLLQTIPSAWPSSVLWVDDDRNLYLFVANEKSPIHQYDHEWQLHLQHDSFADPIAVYKYNFASDDFVLMQTIGIKGVVSLVAYRLTGEIFVVCASRVENRIVLLQLLGYSGFSVVQRIPIDKVKDLHVYWSKDYRLHLAVTSDIQTTILRSTIRGLSLLPVEGKPLFMQYESLVSPGNFLLQSP